MYLSGVDLLESLVAKGGFSAKMVFNAKGAIFFPAERQHRDQKAEGISYEDDYRGNALAAMLAPGKIEIRYHKDFPDQKVADVIRALLDEPRLAFMEDWQASYQGRRLSIS